MAAGNECEPLLAATFKNCFEPLLRSGFVLNVDGHGHCFFDGAVILIACDNPRANELTKNPRGRGFICRKCGYPRRDLWMASARQELMPALINPATGFNVHQDTPIERLHVIFLEVVKRMWPEAVNALKQRQRCFLATLFNVASLSGLSDSISGRHAVFANRIFNGKRWKIVAHLGWVLLSNVLSPNEEIPAAISIFQHINALYQLTMRTRLRAAEVDQIEQICIHISRLIATNNAFSALRSVHKLHLLDHFVEDIRRFGPLGKTSQLFF